MQPILPVKKIKVATRQCYGDADGVVRCEQTSTVSSRCGGNSRLYFFKILFKNGCSEGVHITATTAKENSDIEKVKIKMDP